jgi:hypothetical protein
VTDPPGSSAQLNRLAHEAGVTLAAIVPVQPSLEEIFLSMTGDDEGELAAQRASRHVEVA